MKLFFLILSGLSVVYAQCPPGWQNFEHKCYIVSDHGKSWWRAKTSCEVLGATLAIVGSGEENEFLKTNKIQGWLGATDTVSEGHFIWHDGTEMEYKDFGLGQPDNFFYSEDCLENIMLNGKWNDNHCNMKLPYVCQMTISGDNYYIANYGSGNGLQRRQICYWVDIA